MLVHGVLLVLVLAQVAPPRSSTPPRPSTPAAANDADAIAMAAGWNALGAGRYDAAAQAADAVLQRRPWDRAALLLRIHAFSKASPLQGLDAYEQWLLRRHAEDAGLLEPVA